MSQVVSLQRIHSHLLLLDVPDILNQNHVCEEIYLQPTEKNCLVKHVFNKKYTGLVQIQNTI